MTLGQKRAHGKSPRRAPASTAPVPGGLAGSDLSLFRLLVNQTHDAVFVIDMPTARVLDVNDSACRSLGYTRAELLRLTVFDLDPGYADPALWSAHIDELRAAGSLTFTTQHRRKNGAIFAVEVNSTHAVHLDQHYVIAVARDIAERAEVERERAAHLRYFESMERVNRAMQGQASLDDKLGDVLDVVLAIFECDRAWLLHPCDPYAPTWRVPMERTRPEYPGAAAASLDFPMTPEVAELFHTMVAAAAPVCFGPPPQRPLASMTTQFHVQSQMLVTVRPAIGKPWLLGLHQCSHARMWSADDATLLQSIGRRLGDVLSILLAYRDLEVSEARYRSLFDESFDGLFVTSPSGRVTDINRKGIEILGYDSKSEVLALDLARDVWAHPTEAGRLMGFVGSQGAAEYDIELLKRDGSHILAHCAITAQTDEHGTTIAYRGILRDVTEKRRLEEHLRQAQKMEAFGQLAGGVAHDFNNILTAIQGNAEMLMLDCEGTPEQADTIEEIRVAAQRAARLTRQLLMFSRRQMAEFEGIDVNDVVAHITKMLKRLIREDIQIGMDLTPGGAWVFADPGMVEQVIMNLAVNARDAMPDGGSLRFSTSLVVIDEATAARVPRARAGEFVCLSVHDSGCGIAADVLPHIFEPFFTTKDVGKGTGLGLATVFGIVDQHHGWIEVRSRIGAGTSFLVFLPRYEPPLPA